MEDELFERAKDAGRGDSSEPQSQIGHETEDGFVITWLTLHFDRDERIIIAALAKELSLEPIELVKNALEKYAWRAVNSYELEAHQDDDTPPSDEPGSGDYEY